MTPTALTATCRAVIGAERCGRPSVWLGLRRGLVRPGEAFTEGFCERCQPIEDAAGGWSKWERIET